MRCETARSLLSRYIDGDIDESLKSRLEAHLAECGVCRDELDALRKTVKMLRMYGEVRLDRPLP